MLRIICYCFFIIICIPAKSQTRQQADSLLKAIDRETADSNKLKLYNKIGKYYMNTNAGKAIEYFEKVQEIAKALNLPLKVANSYYDLGFCYRLKADFKNSLANYLESAKIYEQVKDSFRLSNAFISIALIHSETGDYKKVNEYFGHTERLVTALKDSVQLMTLLNSKGNFFDRQGQYDSAMVYLQRSYSIALALKDPWDITNELSNIGLNYKHQGNTTAALHCFDSALAIYKTSNPPADVLGGMYNNIAATQAQAGNFDKAHAAFVTSINYAKQSGNPDIEMENYRNMAAMYGQMKDYKNQVEYQTKYYAIKDSLFTIDNKNQLTGLESDYQLNKKNIEIVKKDAEVSRQKSQRNLFLIVALATVLLLAALAFFYSRTRKNNVLLQQKNGQISAQKNELQTLNQVKDRLFSIISHDLRNPLTTLHSYLSLADGEAVPPEKKQQFKVQAMSAVIHTSNMLDNLLAWANVQIKNTQATIIPLNIADCIEDAVSQVAGQAQQKQLKIKEDSKAVAALGDYDILSIALRNLLTNAIKFSAANTSVLISSVTKDGQVFIAVADEGIGLSAQQIQDIAGKQNNSTNGTQGEKGSGLGLFLVKELLQKINAVLQIDSTLGKGSTFTIVLPAL